MKRAVYFCAMVGGLVGYGEAASIRELYFTPAGRLGIILFAVFMYALYGAVACVLFYPVWRRLRRGSPCRAAVSSSAMAWCLLYGFVYLITFRLTRRDGLLSPPFLLWTGVLVVLSALLSAVAGLTLGGPLRGKRGVYAGIAVFAGITVWMAIPGARRPAPQEGLPNIVLVALDTVRADRLHCYGNGRIRTPTLDGIASEGVLFENAISQIPLTNPSHLSILTSLYPHQHGVVDMSSKHSPEIPKVVHELGRRGYRTAAFVSAFPIDSRFGFSGGFEIYDDDFSRFKGFRSLALVRDAAWLIRNTVGNFERIAGRTTDDAVSWLRSARAPFFLWVHYYDPHGAYLPPPPYSGMYYEGRKDHPDNRSMDGVELPVHWPPWTRNFTDVEYPIAQYDAEITYMDAELGRLLEALDERAGDYILVVVGDHGESFTEHGVHFDHGTALYEEQVRVPLLIRSRGRVGPGRVPQPVETIDIAPTIMELAGLEVPGWCGGESLLPLMKGDASRAREGAVSETGWRKKDGTVDVAYRTDRYKLIVKPGEGVEFYDLAEDPLELRDISKEREDLVKEYGERIRSIMELPRAGEAGAVMDYETEEKLRSLGYIQ